MNIYKTYHLILHNLYTFQKGIEMNLYLLLLFSMKQQWLILYQAMVHQTVQL
jgi:hypothetical protein